MIRVISLAFVAGYLTNDFSIIIVFLMVKSGFKESTLSSDMQKNDWNMANQLVKLTDNVILRNDIQIEIMLIFYEVVIIFLMCVSIQYFVTVLGMIIIMLFLIMYMLLKLF